MSFLTTIDMSIPINIAGTIIEIPASGQDPNWAESIIQFAQVVADNLNAVNNAGDILPNFFTIDALNPGTDVAIPGFTFDTAIVRSAEVSYAIIRQRDSITLVEEGTLHTVYNPNGAPTLKWEVSRDYTGDAQVSFSIDDNGQVKISTTTIAGIGAHSGVLSYRAKSVLNG